MVNITLGWQPSPRHGDPPTATITGADLAVLEAALDQHDLRHEPVGDGHSLHVWGRPDAIATAAETVHGARVRW